MGLKYLKQPNTSSRPIHGELVMDAEQFRISAYQAIDHIINYFKNVDSYAVISAEKPGYLAATLPPTAPVQGEACSAIQQDVISKIIPGLAHWQSSKFMAFFPANTSYASILGDLYASAFNTSGFNWQSSPSAVELELLVLDWIAVAMDLPDRFLSTKSGGGVLHGSASESIIVSMVAARERYLAAKCEDCGLKPGSPGYDEKVRELKTKLTVLASDQTHTCVEKASRIVGVRFQLIKTDLAGGLAVTRDQLSGTLELCHVKGWEPFFLLLNFGTTATCSIDTLEGLDEVRNSSSNLWVHVDAAYAGSALICPEFSSRYSASLRAANSINIGLHKWFRVGLEASCLFVQNRHDITRAMGSEASYYNEKGALASHYNRRAWQIPVGRRFRSLKVWFTLRNLGMDALQRHIRRGVRMGQLFAALIRSRPDLFEIVSEPRFALTCFRICPSALVREVDRANIPKSMCSGSEDWSRIEDGTNYLIRKLIVEVNGQDMVFITGAEAAGKAFIRLVCSNCHTEEKHIEPIFKLIVGITEQRMATWVQEWAGEHRHQDN